MTESGLRLLRGRLHDMLFDDVVPFWLRHSLDDEHGGYRTCLDRDGSVYNDDKSIWMQGRGLWMLSTLAGTVEPKDEWIRAARLGAEFLERHGYDRDGRMFFLVTRDGRPLRKRRYVFSESFASIGFAAWARVHAAHDPTQADAARTIAWRTFRSMHRHLTVPGLLEPKINPETRRIRSLAVPMILIATAQELRGMGDDAFCTSVIDEAARDILETFADPERCALFEHVSGDERPLTGPAARTLNPGHAIEAAWFLLREARERRLPELRGRALELLDWTLARGWDNQYGGFYAFQDIEGRPSERLEWDMKLWWPHNEAMIATLMAWIDTGDDRYAGWFTRIWEYSRTVFHDPEYGEWFGYAHRDGSRSSTLKGSLWKGMFHVPRALYWCYRLCDERLGRNDPHTDALPRGPLA